MAQNDPTSSIEKPDYDENTIWWVYALKQFSKAAGGTLSQRIGVVGPLLAFGVICLLLGALFEHLFFT